MFHVNTDDPGLGVFTIQLRHHVKEIVVILAQRGGIENKFLQFRFFGLVIPQLGQ
jgi:hypothetical protein